MKTFRLGRSSTSPLSFCSAATRLHVPTSKPLPYAILESATVMPSCVVAGKPLGPRPPAFNIENYFFSSSFFSPPPPPPRIALRRSRALLILPPDLDSTCMALTLLSSSPCTRLSRVAWLGRKSTSPSILPMPPPPPPPPPAKERLRRPPRFLLTP